MIEKIKTSFSIDKELHKRMKILSIELGVPYSKLFNEAIKEYLKKLGLI